MEQLFRTKRHDVLEKDEFMTNALVIVARIKSTTTNSSCVMEQTQEQQKSHKREAMGLYKKPFILGVVLGVFVEPSRSSSCSRVRRR